MTGWKKLNLEKLDPPKPTVLHGVSVVVSMSPYDVPRRVRGGFKEEIKKFVIEFEYMSEEALVEQQLDENVSLRVGHNSRRLYEIIIDVHNLRAKFVELRVEEKKLEFKRQIDELIARATEKNNARKDNYEVVKSALGDDESADIVNEFAALFAPGEELAPDDLAEREDYFEAKKRQSKRPTAEEER